MIQGVAVAALAFGATALHSDRRVARATTVMNLNVERNPNFAKLQAGYLFPEIGRRRRVFAEANPELAEKVISLGIGDTTQPIPPFILSGLVEGAKALGTAEGYSGYGAEQGKADLRARIAERNYGGLVDADEVFVSDGAKCDIARLQLMFGRNVQLSVSI